MKKRILSIVLAVLMLVGIMPISAMAATTGTPQTDTGAARQMSVSANSEDKAVHVTKSVNAEGTELTLEAYATNSISKHTSYEPLDIVLVLDVSGSMKYNIMSYKEEYVAKGPKKWTCWKVDSSTYYYKDGDAYYKVEVKSRDEWHGFLPTTYYYLEANGKRIGDEVTGYYSDKAYGDVLYTYERVNTDTTTKIAALQKAVNAFIDSVASQKDSDSKPIENRISIVKFAGDKIKWTGANEGNDKYVVDRDSRNYSQVVKGLKDASTGADELKRAVSTLTYGGATSADFGMELAKDVLDRRTDKTRKSVVIMFTDGEPNHGNYFDPTVANSAINAAKTLKGGKTLVYTIGMFTNADPALDPESDSTSETNKYMHAVSSNYPKATAYTNLGDRAENSNYYLDASNAGDLDDVFQAISQDIGTLTATIDDSSVLSDTLSQMFTFNPPAGADNSGIKVYKQPVKADGTDDVGHRTELTEEDGVKVKVDGKTLKVEGFDYGKNAVTVRTDAEGNVTGYSGYKLVVTIPIQPDKSYKDWKYGPNDYPTNDTVESKAGLEYGETGSRQKVELTESPEAPVTGYKVTYEFQGDVPSGVIAPTDSKVYIKGQDATVKTVTTSVEGEYQGKKGTFDFGGWYHGDVKINTETIEINDDVTLTGEWKFTENIKYGVKYEYVSSDPTNHPLPTEISTQHAVTDDTEYYVGDPVTNKGPTVNTKYTMPDNSGTWTLTSWTPESATMAEGGVTFTGTWTFKEADKPDLRVTKTAKVNGEELSEGEKAKVGDTITYTITVTNTGNTTLTGVKVEDTFEAGAADTLSFTGNGLPQNATLEPGQTISITATYVVVEADYGKTIKNTAVAKADDDTTGSAEVTTKVDPKPEPPQTEYKIELPISKELRLRSGSHPGTTTFWFDVSYYNAGEEKFEHAGEFSITLADRQTDKQETVTVPVSEEVYRAISQGASVRVVEQDLGENGFEYDTTPGLGAAVVFWVDTTTNIVDTSNVRPTDNTLYITPFPQAGNDFDFVNYYGKSGKVEKPVKVGPQLNRDDHVAYIMGYPDGTVQPEGEITRAEACTIFFRLLTDSSRDYYFARTNDYSDVNAGDWFNNAISTLSNAGIVTGYNDGTFRPNQPITRGEMAKIIANFANLKYGGKTFTDLAGHWSKSYVELAAGNGWIAGYPDGSFRPDQKITRAETVTMINRVLERVPAKESRLLSRSIMLTFPDNNPGDWYYIAIQEASNSHEYQRSVYETTGDEMWTKLIDNVDWTKLEK